MSSDFQVDFESVLKLQLELQRLITRLLLIAPWNNCKFAVVELFIAGRTPESEFRIRKKIGGPFPSFYFSSSFLFTSVISLGSPFRFTTNKSEP